MKLHHKLTTWLTALGSLAYVGAALPPVVDLNSGGPTSSAISRGSTVNLVTPPSSAGFDSNLTGWTATGAAAHSSDAGGRLHISANTNAAPNDLSGVSRPLVDLTPVSGATVSAAVSFKYIFRREGATPGNRELEILIKGVKYASVTTPASANSPATVSVSNGAVLAGPSSVSYGDNEMSRPMVTLGFQIPTSVPLSNGDLVIRAKSGTDLIAVDDVAVAATHQNLIANGTFDDSSTGFSGNGSVQANVDSTGNFAYALGSNPVSPNYSLSQAITAHPSLTTWPNAETATLAINFKVKWTETDGDSNAAVVLRVGSTPYATMNSAGVWSGSNGASVSPSFLLPGQPLANVSVTLPQLSALDVTTLSFTKSGASGGDNVIVDDIRVTGTQTKDTNYNFEVANYNHLSAPTPIAEAGASIRGPQVEYLDELVVTVAENFLAGDALTLPGGVPSDFNVALSSITPQVITIKGVQTIAKYLDVLKAIRFDAAERTNQSSPDIKITVRAHSLEGLYSPTPLAQAIIHYQDIDDAPVGGPDVTLANLNDSLTGPNTLINNSPKLITDPENDTLVWSIVSTDANSGTWNDNSFDLFYSFNSGTGVITVRTSRHTSQKTGLLSGQEGVFTFVLRATQQDNPSLFASRTIKVPVKNILPQASDKSYAVTTATGTPPIYSNQISELEKAPVAPATVNTNIIAGATDADNDFNRAVPQADIVPVTNLQSVSPAGPKSLLTVEANGRVVFNPNGAYNSANAGDPDIIVEFHLPIRDGDGEDGVRKVFVTVRPVDDPPYLVNFIPDHNAAQGGPFNPAHPSGYDLRDFFGDDAGQKPLLSYTITSTPSLPGGVTVTQGTNQATIGGTWPSNVTGSYTITVTATDGVSSVNDTFVVSVANAAPQLVAVNNGSPTAVLTINEDTSTPVTLRVWDDDALGKPQGTDPDGDGPLVAPEAIPSFRIISTSNGSVTPTTVPHTTPVPTNNLDQLFTFTPAFNYSGPASFTVEIRDSENLPAQYVVNFIVNAVNDPPYLESVIPPLATTDGTTITPIDLRNYFKDYENNPLTFSVVNLPLGLTFDVSSGIISGTLDKNASNGHLTVVPQNTYTVTAQAQDPTSSSGWANFNITVLNKEPNPQPDNLGTISTTVNGTGTVALGNVKTNDTDTAPDSDALEVEAATVAGTPGGQFQFASDGATSFILDSSFNNLALNETRVVTGEYWVREVTAPTVRKKTTVTVTVSGVNNAPTFANGSPITRNDGWTLVDADSTYTLSDVDNSPPDTRTYNIEGTAPGGISVNANGKLTGKIAANASGPTGSQTYNFKVVLTDGSGQQAKADHSITVYNAQPVANSDTLSISASAASGSVNVAANDHDGPPPPVAAANRDGDTLTYTPATDQPVAGGGRYDLTSAGQLTFRPNGDFDNLIQGQPAIVTINYTVSDGLLTATSAVTVTVTGVNDGPVVTEPTAAVYLLSGTAKVIGLKATDKDAGAQLTYELVTPPSRGTLSPLSAGPFGSGVVNNVTYTPDPGWVGPDSFTFTVKDQTNLVTTKTVDLQVYYNNLPPFQSSTPPNRTNTEIDPVNVSIAGFYDDPNLHHGPPPLANPEKLTFTATGLPPGLTMSTSGVITGTITGPAADNSPYLVRILVKDNGDPNPEAPPVNDNNLYYPSAGSPHTSPASPVPVAFTWTITPVDTDGDGVRDNLDQDKDGDGIPDATEDAYALGANKDTDGDGIPDRLDLDSDNDGIWDAVEAGYPVGAVNYGNGKQLGGVGTDGIVNTIQTNPNGGAETVIYAVVDTDFDGRPDYVDLDSDNDTISDLVESGFGIANPTFSGIAPAIGSNGVPVGVGLSAPSNRDADSLADYRDLDSDNDGIKDISTNGWSRLDVGNDGVIDSLADIDLDGVADSFDTNTSIAGGFRLAGHGQWAGLPANSSDTDLDVFPITQEYALGGDPKSGKHQIVGSAHSTGLALGTDGVSSVSATVVRPQGRFDAQYKLFLSTDLAAWTEVTSAPLVVPNIGDETDNLVWNNLQATSPAYAGGGYARVRITAGGVTSYTLPQGWDSTSIQGQRQTYAPVFVGKPLYTGKISAASGSSITVDSNGENLSSLFGAAPAAYYIEITSGASQGHRFDIDTATSGVNAFGVLLASANNTATTLPTNLASSHYVVRQHLTLAGVLPPAQWQAGSSSGNADQISFYKNGGFSTYFKLTNGNWVQSGPSNQGHTVIAPGSGVFIAKVDPNASRTVVLTGEVRYNDFRNRASSASNGYNLIGTGYPLDATPVTAGITSANGFAATGTADTTQLQIWDGDSIVNGSGYTALSSVLRPPGWRKASDNSVNMNNVVLFPASRAGLLKVISDITWPQSQPWTDALRSKPYQP